MNTHIKIIDSFPGSGKTQWSIQKINELPLSQKIIYVTPYLNEVTRIINSCPQRRFEQPEEDKETGRTKMNNLMHLIASGKNVVTTHALFGNINDTLIRMFEQADYILFLDEVIQTIEPYDFDENKSDEDDRQEIIHRDVNSMLERDIIRVNEDYLVIWTSDEIQLSKYENFKRLAQKNLLYYINNSLLLLTFPNNVFSKRIFSEIYILTYMFKSQLQAYYYDYFKLDYSVYEVYKTLEGKYDIRTGNTNENEWRELISRKIHILDDDKLNRIGDIYLDPQNRLRDSALSKTWYARNHSQLGTIKKNLVNYFQNKTKSKAHQRMWTCFKSEYELIKSDKTSLANFVALNARATNNYRDRSVLAYPINRYLNHYYSHFFQKRGIQIDQDLFALSEMVQWICRSRVRDDEDIHIYVPSTRMRNLLINHISS
jgi:hypothetical protein